MKTDPTRPSPCHELVCAALLLLCALMLTGAPPVARAAATPPDFMSYQGFLVDGNGNPLAPNNPANYPIIFRIFSAPLGGAILWSEQQIVTVDKGNFSVVLGEGTPVSGESRPPLSSVFTNNSASDLYMSILVTIGGSALEILPRLRLLPAPYSFLATSASRIVQPNGSPVLNYANGRLEVTGDLFTSGTVRGDGSGLTLTSAQIPATLSGNRVFSGNVGIGAPTPNFPLVIGNNTLGDKISLSGQSGPSYGFGVAPLTLQIHTDIAAADIAFGYGSSAAMTETMRIKGSGRVGIGTSTPEATLHVSGFLMLDAGSFGGRWSISPETHNGLPGGNRHLYFYHEGVRKAAINADTGNYVPLSDLRLKTDINELGSVLDRVGKLRPVSYRFKSATNSAHKSMGFIAQEVEPLFPEVVTEMNGFKGLSYSELIPVAIGAIQQLHSLIQQRDLQLTMLREKADRVDELEEKLTALKKQVALNEQATAQWETRFSTLEKALTKAPAAQRLTPGASVAE